METSNFQNNQTGFIGNICIKEEEILPDEKLENEGASKLYVRSITSELNPNLKLPGIKPGMIEKKISENNDFTANVKTEPPDIEIVDNSSRDHVLNSDENSFENLIKAQFEEASQVSRCGDCNKKFPNKYLMQSHQRKAHSGKFECKQCHKKFWKKQLLVIHLSDHTDNPNFVLQQQLISIANDEGETLKSVSDPALENPYQCQYCKKTFVTNFCLNRHLYRYKNMIPYDCPICDEKFHTEHQLKNHSLSHVKEGPFQCKGCEEKFEHPYYLLAHQKFHSSKDYGIKSVESSFDGKENSGKSILGEQLTSHTEEKSSDNYKAKENNLFSEIEKEIKLENEKAKLSPMVECQCGKKVKKKYFPRHLRTHTGAYECRECDKKFAEKYYYEQHMNLHTGRRTYECHICKQKFLAVKPYKIHMKNHGEIESTERKSAFECDKCGQSFLEEIGLTDHITVAHSKDGEFRCDHCQRVFRTRRYSILHLRRHTKENLHKCDECEKAYTSRWLLNVHKRSHTGETPYQCSLCPRKFTLRAKLNDHLNKHRGFKPYKCDQCNLGFWKKDALNGHIRVHTGEKPYKCEICNECFRLRYNLKLHLKVHSDEKLFECKICSRKFKRASYLANHQTTHTGETPHKCNLCKRKYRFKWQLNIHYKVHTGEGLFKCSKCDKSFLTNCRLKVHFRKHTGERPYKCGQCDKAFITNTLLKYHMRVHTGEKPFTCEICNSKFSKKLSLSRHLFSHNKEKGEECNKSFEYEKNLIAHQTKIDHVEKELLISYQCVYCAETFPDSISFESHQRLHDIKKENPGWLSEN